MGEPNCNDKVDLKKGPWTREEDQKLLAYIEDHGHGSWRTLPAKAGLQRCGKSCRLRWTNYLRPDIKRGKFSTHEEKAIIRLHALLGNRWSAIAAHLPKRTDNEIKNYWNTRLKKRLTRMGIDPTTHKPKNNPVGSAQYRHAAALSHMAQWETARLEAEARLARVSKLAFNLRLPRKATVPPPPAPPPCLDVLKAWQATTMATCFFTSPGALESPNSTPNLSLNSPKVPTVSTIMANDFIPTDNNCGACGVGQTEYYHTGTMGEMENSLYNCTCSTIYDFDMKGSIDHASSLMFNHDSDVYKIGGSDVGEFEASENYWKELLDLVSSNMMM